MKRVFDVLVSATAMVVLLPVFGLLAAAVWLSLGSPVLFMQERPGRGGKPFTMIKFRTMRVGSKGGEGPEPDEERLTRLGRLLRSTSLDELPELWNVLKGDMSLVGPRPLLMEYLPLYSPTEARRHEVRPGITGWAQVSGRNTLPWEERFKLDVWYVDNRSFWMDLRILGMTVVRVIRQEGISEAGRATATPFTRDSMRGPDRAP